MIELKKLRLRYLGEWYTIIFKDSAPRKTTVYNENGEECERIARKILREEVKRLNLSKDGYLYDRNGVELITNNYFRKIYSLKNKDVMLEENIETVKYKNINKKEEKYTLKNNISEILEFGFERAGEFFLEKDKLKYNLELKENKYEKNILYLFVADEEIKYIGKTTKGAKQRLNQYCNPGASQRTNIKINDLIKNNLLKNKKVEVYLFEDDSLIYRKIEVNLPAGLEDNLIDKFKPEWNVIGR